MKSLTRRNLVKAAAGLVAFIPAARNLAMVDVRACVGDCQNPTCYFYQKTCYYCPGCYNTLNWYNCYDDCTGGFCYTEQLYTSYDCFNLGTCYCGH